MEKLIVTDIDYTLIGDDRCIELILRNTIKKNVTKNWIWGGNWKSYRISS